MVLYSGVPETPAQRRNKVESQLQQLQHKMEIVMHLLTHHLETGDKGALGGAAAWTISAWQDINEQRRTYLAGRQAWKLDSRQVDKRPKLRTQNEEKKMKPQYSGKGRGRPGTSWAWAQSETRTPPQREWNSNSDWRSRSRSRDGKGKGKKL